MNNNTTEKKNFMGDSLRNELIKKSPALASIIEKYSPLGLISEFGEEEWEKIRKQNFPDLPGGFYEVFERGINEGNCGAVSKRLSYSYDNVSLVNGILPMLTGTTGSPNGKHTWMETKDYIYDTTLLLKINKQLKQEMGYIDEVVVGPDILNRDPFYQARKEFVNDPTIKHSNDQVTVGKSR
jgi:hypothetical protein